MSALYLGVVVLPLVVLIWNLGLGGWLRRAMRRGREAEPAGQATPRTLWLLRLRAAIAAQAVRARAVFARSAVSAEEATSPSPPAASRPERAPDLPRASSLAPDWVPTSGYAARPRA